MSTRGHHRASQDAKVSALGPRVRRELGGLGGSNPLTVWRRSLGPREVIMIGIWTLAPSNLALSCLSCATSLRDFSFLVPKNKQSPHFCPLSPYASPTSVLTAQMPEIASLGRALQCLQLAGRQADRKHLLSGFCCSVDFWLYLTLCDSTGGFLDEDTGVVCYFTGEETEAPAQGNPAWGYSNLRLDLNSRRMEACLTECLLCAKHWAEYWGRCKYKSPPSSFCSNGREARRGMNHGQWGLLPRMETSTQGIP